MSPKPRKNEEEAEVVLDYLRSNPMASYGEIGKLFPGREDVNPNSIIKKLQRDGRIEVVKQVSDIGRFVGSYKKVL